VWYFLGKYTISGAPQSVIAPELGPAQNIGRQEMSNVTRQGVEDILGVLNDDDFAAIEATGASLAQVTEAKSLADGTSDVVGTGESALAGPVKEVLIILGGRNV
jgi:hypothetical protein